MESDTLTTLLSERVRLVRNEYQLSQEKMAGLLGLSKKTLVQVEKGRSPLGWSAVVALCALFPESEVLRAALGEDPLEVVKTVVFCNLDTPREQTLGGRVWWRELKRAGGFRVQQNLVSGHYRILDNLNRRWHSSFDLGYIEVRFNELTQPQGGGPIC